MNTLFSDEDDSRPAPTSSLTGNPPAATATATAGVSMVAYVPTSGSINPSPTLGPQLSQHQGPGYTWLAKLRSGRAAGAGVALPHQLPSSSAVFTAGVAQPHHQHSQSPYNNGKWEDCGYLLSVNYLLIFCSLAASLGLVRNVKTLTQIWLVQ